MADTPEVKVKKEVKKILDKLGIYWFYPVASGYGRAGIPDIVASLHGRFMGIECKANKGHLTELQVRELKRIEGSRGISLVVDETSMGVLYLLLSNWHASGAPAMGVFMNLTEQGTDLDADEDTPD